MHEKDQLDLLIDSALATYAEPSSDLEQRVLNALAADRLPVSAKSKQVTFPWRRWMPWAVGLAAAACLALVLFIHHYATPRGMVARNALSPQLPHATAPTGITETGRTHVAFARTRKPHAPVAPTPALPKLDVFPSPQPLTPQEQALVVFVAQAPETERKAVAEAQQKIEAPISVAAIHIPPLDSPDKGQP